MVISNGALLKLLTLFSKLQLVCSIAAEIASFMIAFIAFIPTIRQRIFPRPDIVYIEILGYFILYTSFLAR